MRATIFDHAPTGLALLRCGDGRILEANAAFARMVGLSRADVRERTFPELVAKADPAVPVDLSGVLRGEAEAVTGSAWLRADGREPRRHHFRAARTPVAPDAREQHVVLCLERATAGEPANGDPPADGEDASTAGGISPGAAAAALGVSSSTIRRWIDDGRLRAHRTAGGHRRIPDSEIRRLRASGRRAVRVREPAPPEGPLPVFAQLLADAAERMVDQALLATYDGPACGWFSEAAARAALGTWLDALAAACRDGRYAELGRPAEAFFDEARLCASLLECQTFAERLDLLALRELAAVPGGRAELPAAQRLTTAFRRALLRVEDRRG